MLIPYLIFWVAGIACAATGCTLPTVALGLVLIIIIFRSELLKLVTLGAGAVPTDSS